MADEARYGIAELAEEAGVSVRTVRYYIAEGLLPPAVTAGARSYYTREHLDRLRAIGRMKDAYLPLREIRRHLAAMDEEAIRAIAAESAEEESAALPGSAEPPMTARAMEERDAAPPASEPSAFTAGREDARPSQAARRMLREPRPSSASEYIARVLGRSAGRPPAAPRVPLAPAPAPRDHAAQAPTEAAAWRRIRIGDDAELLIREDAYHRRRDKIEWLVDWARKVLG